MIGNVNLMKMNILLRLLYPLQMIPLNITKKVIADLERHFSKFIWNKRKPRIRLLTLQLPKDKGWLAFPHHMPL